MHTCTYTQLLLHETSVQLWYLAPEVRLYTAYRKQYEDVQVAAGLVEQYDDSKSQQRMKKSRFGKRVAILQSSQL